MKKSYFLLFVFCLPAWLTAYSQAPDGYYDSALGKKGRELQYALSQIIDNHFVLDFGSTDATRYMDVTPDNYVYDIYSYPCCHIPPTATGTGTTSQCEVYSFEHLFCQNWFNPDFTYNCSDNAPFPICSDLHHVFPTDHYVNSSYHNNSPYGDVYQPRKISQNGTRWGYANYATCDPSVQGIIVFEPADEFKGDVARALLYISIRYMNEDETFGESEMTLKSQFKPWALELLKRWAAADPVSQKEINRNNIIFNRFQDNRNPLIDHPELVELLWGSDSLYNTFGAVGAEDALRPVVTDVTLQDASHVVVTFSKELNATTAEDITHYAFSRGWEVASASYQSATRQVVLTLAKPLIRNFRYSLYISNILSSDGYYVKATSHPLLNGSYHSDYSACKLPRTLLALWSFDDFEPEVPLVVPANTDEGFPEIYNHCFIYADSTHGSSYFDDYQLGNNTGDLGGDPRAAAYKGKSLTLKTGTANGQSVVLAFSTKNWKEIVLTFVDKRSSTGFDTHTWEWSLDGELFAPIPETANTIDDFGDVYSTSVWLMREIDLRTLDVNDKDSVFLRLTVDGAYNQGSNSFDNISLWGEPLDYTHIRPLTAPQGFLLYPNPTHDNVTVEAPGLVEVKVYGVMGREVKRVAANGQQKVTFSVEELPAGLYVVRAIERNGRQMSQKMLVVK